VRTVLLGIGAALVAAVLFLAVLDLAVMPSLVEVNRVKVPQLRGLTVKQARQRLSQVGLNAAIADSVYHETLPAGAVVDQDPAENQSVKQGRRVRLEVSIGPHFYVVPTSVVGTSQRQAELQLRASHLSVGEVSFVSSTSMPEGVVVHTNPEPGSSLTRGARVDMKISSGPPTLPKPVPVVVGLPLEAVQDTLRKYEMRLGTVASQVSYDYPVGTVVAQTPGPTERVLPQSAIDVVVCVQDTAVGLPGVVPGAQEEQQ